MSNTPPTSATQVSALAVASLSFNYAQKKALDNVSLSIGAGELVILLGPNGAGKTTLFSLICGLFAPTSGQVTINGQPLLKRAEALAPLGIVFQAQTLDLDLSVKQNLLYFAALHGLPKALAHRRIDEALNTMDLQGRAEEKVRNLNGGHRRRVEIIRATLHEPALLLLDEPTVGLDIPTRAALIDSIRALPTNNGCAILWATHLIDEIRETDRVALLHKGQLREDGVAQDLLEKNKATDLPALMQAL